ncbi:MAG: delta-60 repeat domain-containing protein [Bradymonadaceae bacterium]|nr:delta-60 repeat domain-containing protein [Lujinxingiaceae bacterium]
MKQQWSGRAGALIAIVLLLAACSDDPDPVQPPIADVGSDTALDVGPDSIDEDADPGDDASEVDASEDTSDDAGDADLDTDPGLDFDPSVGTWSNDYTSPGLLGESGARVNSLLRDEDGRIYAGGMFSVAGKAPSNNVAWWNGTIWQQVGYGIDIEVEAMAFDAEGAIYAGGSASSGGGGIGIGFGSTNYLMKWDGLDWAHVAAFDADFRSTINALAVLPDGKLVVGGMFDAIDDEPFLNLALWDGQSWSTLGGQSPDGTVRTIVRRANGDLCIGGDFEKVGELVVNQVACWDGTAWQALGDGMTGFVNVLLEREDGDLIAGGTFVFITDFDTGDYLASLGIWDGTSWESLANGVENGFINDVRALAEGPQGELYVGGTFGMVGKNAQNLAARHIARLDGETWSALGDGLSNSVGAVLGSVVGTNAILVDNFGSVVAAGLFSNAGDAFAINAALWENESWSAISDENATYLGLGGLINVMEVAADGSIYAAGYFSHAGGVEAENVARLGANGWEALGTGLNGAVFAMAIDAQGRVYAGGDFANIQPSGAAFFARWNGALWERVGENLNGPARTILVAPNGDLYVGGDFTTAGNLAVEGIARFDGTDWHAVGAGFNERVTSLAMTPDGTLYAGGTFTESSDGEPLDYLASFDGTAWHQVGGGLDSYVSHLTVYKGKLLVAGQFTMAGETEGNSVATWDGEQWQSLGGGLFYFFEGLAPVVSNVVVHPIGVFATGTFELSAQGTELSYIAYFDGTEWKNLGEGISDLGEALIVTDDSLLVGGTFTLAGGMPSYGMARWDFAKE